VLIERPDDGATPRADSAGAPSDGRLPGWARRVALGLVGLAILVRAVPAALLFGTIDVRIWETLAPLPLSGENFYATGLHNWPPLWIYLLAGLWLVHGATGLPFPFLFKLPPIGADAASPSYCIGSDCTAGGGPGRPRWRGWPTRSTRSRS
jgi:hypothetical protein